MKAISVKQPWVGNIAVGKKTAEIRSRRIKPMGDILICSAQLPFEGIGRYQCNNNKLWQPDGMNNICDIYGHAIAVVNWYDTVIFTKYLAEAACFDPARWPFEFYTINEIETTSTWAWMFKNARLIKHFPVKGKQGFFEVDDSLIEFI